MSLYVYTNTTIVQVYMRVHVYKHTLTHSCVCMYYPVLNNSEQDAPNWRTGTSISIFFNNKFICIKYN